MGRPDTTEHPARTPAPVSRRQIIGLPAGHLKDAYGAATRPGSARSLTCPDARHEHGCYRETGDASHARPKRSRYNLKPQLNPA